MTFDDLFHIEIHMKDLKMDKFIDGIYSSIGTSLGTVAVAVLVYLVILLVKFFMIWKFPIKEASTFYHISLLNKIKLFFKRNKFERWYDHEYGEVDWDEVALELSEHISYTGTFDLLIKNIKCIVIEPNEKTNDFEGIKRKKIIDILLELEQISNEIIVPLKKSEESTFLTIYELKSGAIENIQKCENNDNLAKILSTSHKNKMINEFSKREREWWKKILTLKISELPLESKQK